MKSVYILFLSGILPAFAATGSCRAQQMTGDADHSEYILNVDEYCPAPGQFVGLLPQYEPGDTPESMAEKCTRAIGGPVGATAEDDMAAMVSLGSWGGYITFHFDHSIANIPGKRDLFIAGNAFAGSSEPGIVMVMKDENHNGKADDTWYELSGSADVDSVGKVRYGYQVTYTLQPMQDTPWTDNEGNSGTVPRNAYHEDNEYFPLWQQSPLTFTGTRLPDNVYMATKRPKTYAMRALRYGYVDNLPNSDVEGCSFDLSWAVDLVKRESKNLDFIDFVRIYSATLQVISASVGEASTEVQGARDLHLAESLQAISQAQGIVAADGGTPAVVSSHDLQGRRMRSLQPHTLQVVRLSNGMTRKIHIR